MIDGLYHDRVVFKYTNLYQVSKSKIKLLLLAKSIFIIVLENMISIRLLQYEEIKYQSNTPFI